MNEQIDLSKLPMEELQQLQAKLLVTLGSLEMEKQNVIRNVALINQYLSHLESQKPKELPITLPPLKKIKLDPLNKQHEEKKDEM